MLTLQTILKVKVLSLLISKYPENSTCEYGGPAGTKQRDFAHVEKYQR